MQTCQWMIQSSIWFKIQNDRRRRPRRRFGNRRRNKCNHTSRLWISFTWLEQTQKWLMNSVTSTNATIPMIIRLWNSMIGIQRNTWQSVLGESLTFWMKKPHSSQLRNGKEKHNYIRICRRWISLGTTNCGRISSFGGDWWRRIY